ncbi:MAG: virulence protein E [Mediterranea massiliensis]|nr:virulence protein E [Mediterranea massiliensis]
MNRFSLFNGLTGKKPQTVGPDELMRLMREDSTVRELTEKYRHYLQQGEPEMARRYKNLMPCFGVAALFEGGKQQQHIRQFTGCSLVDVDGIGTDEVERLRRVAEEDAHTLFAHPTVSGKGLRILFRYALPEGYNLDTLLTTTPRQALLLYKQAFIQGNEYYKQRLGLSATDGQCKNVTRLSCLAHCPDIRYHPDAQPLPITLPEERGNKRHKMGEKQFERVVQSVLKTLAQRGLTYGKGRRNEYLSQAFYLMNRYGMEQQRVERWAVERFADYHCEQDVTAIVASCYRNEAEHGTLSLPQSEDKQWSKVKEIEGFMAEIADIRHNVVTRLNEICWRGSDTWQPLTDRDEGTLWSRMNKQFGNTRIGDVRLVLSSDFVPLFNPFADYFYHLPPWHPGDTDYMALLADTVQLSDNTPENRRLFENCLSKWLVAMVVGFLSDRVNHEILVFIGKQGIYKTTWFHYLLPPQLRPYFVPKSNSRRMSKDDRLLMAECGLICLEEIVSMTDEEVDQIKAAVSLPHVVERAAYARNKEVRPHIASFCGTGNHLNFLTDLTGNRRWLPFEVSNIRSPYEHTLPYDGIYSQAMYRWQSGFTYWFDADEIALLAEHIVRFEAPNLEEELILTYYRKPYPGEEGIFVTTAHILGCINSGMKQTLSPIRIGLIMRKLGFESIRKANVRGYRVVELKGEEIYQNRKRIANESMTR